MCAVWFAEMVYILHDIKMEGTYKKNNDFARAAAKIFNEKHPDKHASRKCN